LGGPTSTAAGARGALPTCSVCSSIVSPTSLPVCGGGGVAAAGWLIPPPCRQQAGACRAYLRVQANAARQVYRVASADGLAVRPNGRGGFGRGDDLLGWRTGHAASVSRPAGNVLCPPQRQMQFPTAGGRAQVLPATALRRSAREALGRATASCSLRARCDCKSVWGVQRISWARSTHREVLDTAQGRARCACTGLESAKRSMTSKQQVAGQALSLSMSYDRFDRRSMNCQVSTSLK